MGKSNKKKKKTFSEILGERIRYFRKKTGLSLRNFGYECDMEKSNLGRIERGETVPTVTTLRRICKCSKIKLKELRFAAVSHQR